LFSISSRFGPRRGRRGREVAAMASARRHAPATPSTRPHESLRASRMHRESARRPLLRGPGRRVAARGTTDRTSKLWRGVPRSGAPRTVRRRLERVAHVKKRKSPLRASYESSAARRPGHSIVIRRRRHGLVRGARGSGGAGPRRLPQRRLGADGPGDRGRLCGNQSSSALQFEVCCGLREVLLALRGRGYPSEIVSEFELKT